MLSVITKAVRPSIGRRDGKPGVCSISGQAPVKALGAAATWVDGVAVWPGGVEVAGEESGSGGKEIRLWMFSGGNLSLERRLAEMDLGLRDGQEEEV